MSSMVFSSERPQPLQYSSITDLFLHSGEQNLVIEVIKIALDVRVKDRLDHHPDRGLYHAIP
jgi:hypothetical protein